MKIMKKIAEKFTTNIGLIALIMLRDLKDLFNETYNYLTKNQIKMEININWYDFIIKLFMATALMLVFRQYYKMKKEVALSRLFSFVLYEMQHKPDTLMGVDRNKIIQETKDKFLSKANELFKNDMLQPDIEKMVNDYFDYNKTYLPII